MPESSAVYQRRRRERLRGQGLIKREIWVPPSAADIVRRVERALQDGIVPVIPSGRALRSESQMSEHAWTFDTLYQTLVASEPAREGHFTLQRIEGAEPVMVATMHEFGDLPVTISVAGSQISMGVLLWPVAAVADQAAFDRELLLAHKMIPLSTFGITPSGEGELWYEIFGALASNSSFETVMIELETLADNAIDVSELYEDRVTRTAA